MARNIKHNCVNRVPVYVPDETIKGLRDISEIETRYYLRLSVVDKPGGLAGIAAILGKNNISIASVVQKERKQARIVPVVMMTHDCREKDMRLALDEINRMSMIRKKTVALRVER